MNFELHHNLTTVDAPETVYYVRSVMEQYGQKKLVETETERFYQYGDKGFIHLPELSMWQLIVKKQIPPKRLVRYCCSELKEKGGKGRMQITGVRWAESRSRKENSGLIRIIGKPKTTQKSAIKSDVDFRITAGGGIVLNNDNTENRRFVEHCYRTTSTSVNPIVDWTDEEVWEFLHHYGCKSNPLYQRGEKRIGCIGCPMQGSKGMKRDFANYPTYRAAYIRAFDKMLEARKAAGKKCEGIWIDGEHVMRWWVGDITSKN